MSHPLQDADSAKKPRFSAGEEVVAVGPDPQHSGKCGVVMEVIQGPGFVYRYLVHLSDGSISTFFGFELDG